jgi:hypothetical protein
MEMAPRAVPSSSPGGFHLENVRRLEHDDFKLIRHRQFRHCEELLRRSNPVFLFGSWIRFARNDGAGDADSA